MQVRSNQRGIAGEAHRIFRDELKGIGTTEVIRDAFKSGGLFSDYEESQIIHDWEMRKTRDILRNIKMVVEDEDGNRTTVRLVHNIEKQDGNVYKLLKSMDKDEIKTVARTHDRSARIHDATRDILMDIVNGNLIL